MVGVPTSKRCELCKNRKIKVCSGKEVQPICSLLICLIVWRSSAFMRTMCSCQQGMSGIRAALEILRFNTKRGAEIFNEVPRSNSCPQAVTGTPAKSKYVTKPRRSYYIQDGFRDGWFSANRLQTWCICRLFASNTSAPRTGVSVRWSSRLHDIISFWMAFYESWKSDIPRPICSCHTSP